MRNSRGKTAFIVERSIWSLVKRSLVSIFCTFTFSENLTDLGEAKRRWHNLVRRMERIRKTKGFDLEGCGVWERQKRGAWHLHVVINSFIDVNWLRSTAVECGFGPQMRLEYIRGQNKKPPGLGAFKDIKVVVRYLLKYVLKTMDDADSGKGVVTYFGGSHVKRGTTAFSWDGWKGRVARQGRAFLEELAYENPDDASEFGWYAGGGTLWTTCFWVGLHVLTDRERADLALRYDGFARFCAGPPGDGNWLEPF